MLISEKEQQQLKQLPHQGIEMIKINADNNTKQYVFIQWLSFFLINLVIYLSLLAIPDTFVQNGINPCSLYTNISFLNYSCAQQQNPQKKQIFLIPDYSKMNMFIYINARVRLINQRSTESSKQEIQYQITFYSVMNVSNQLINKELIFHPKSGMVQAECRKNNRGYLQCDYLAAFVSNIDSGSYLVEMEIQQNETRSFTNLEILTYSLSKSFIHSLIAIRYTFFLLSIITGIVYVYRLKQAHQTQLVIEQKFILALSGLVILFNDPLFAISILIPNTVTIILNVFFVVNFVVVLLLFWVTSMDRMCYENGKKQSIALNWKKILPTIILWISMILCYSFLQTDILKDPSKTYESMNSIQFLVFQIISFFIVAIMLLYITFHYIKFCKDYHQKIWRNKIQAIFSLYFIFCLTFFFFSGSFQIYNFDGNRIIICFSSLNLYIYYMQYLWAPSKEGIQQSETVIQQELSIYNKEQDQVYEQIDEDQNEIRISFQGT